MKRQSTAGLLRLFADVLDELRRRGVVRSSNNPVADLAESIGKVAFKLKLTDGSNPGYDGKGPGGHRYQIKGRRQTAHNMSTQLGAIRNLNRDNFDYLVAILFDEHFRVKKALRMKRAVVKRHARWSDHVHAHLLTLTGLVLDDALVQDVTRRVQWASRAVLRVSH